MTETEDMRLARLKEQYRCEKIIQNYIRTYKDDGSKSALLKRLLARIRQKEK
jgi:hypothetical protein